MNEALSGTDPVISSRASAFTTSASSFHEGGVPTEYYEVKLGDPDVKREGKDVTILTIGRVLYRALDAAKTLEEKYGISAEIIGRALG